eukprot:TRINITY_DN1581_c0_g1_i3.p1 TRINITY_DN1581_c0_g1~~TRINITY_DN1581_c0_g1_i3.p1  ORF type:complete len:476 (-),score=63.53 TRINITY_DN1581_c0_g1_i3:236-1663(-)
MEYFAVGGRPWLSRFPPHILAQRFPSQGAEKYRWQPGCYPEGANSDARGPINGSSSTSTSIPVCTQDVNTSQQDVPFALPQPPPAQALHNGFNADEGADKYSWQPGRCPEGANSDKRGPIRGSSSTSTSIPVCTQDVDNSQKDDLPFALPQPPPAPALHTGFNADEVTPWEADEYEYIRKLQDATRNRGHVHLMRHLPTNMLVAVKQMPNVWVQTCHADFVAEHPSETELPWQDVGCVKLLNTGNYEYACTLLGVHRDAAFTYVVTTFCQEGDLFSWCETGGSAGPEREQYVRPLVWQILKGVQQLHDKAIVHRDLSLENILLEKMEDNSLRVRIIDFGMCSTSRYFRRSVRGKASYQAPELHGDDEYDAFLTDVFSVGVVVYALFLKDYPWLSTRPGGCKCFEYIRKHGFRPYLSKRKHRNSGVKVADLMSDSLKQLLEGLLAFKPEDRLTLGECAWTKTGRRSVWDEPWLREG